MNIGMYMDMITGNVTFALIILGVIGFNIGEFANVLPFIGKYGVPLKYLSIAVLVTGVWFAAVDHTSEIYKKKEVAMEMDILKIREASSQENVKIVTQFLNRDRIIHDKGETIIQYVEKNANQMDAQCKVDPSVIKAMNDAATITSESSK